MLTVSFRAGVCALAAATACARSPKLAWHDEFDGRAGATYDRTNWVPDVGGKGFGNHERELYTESANAALDGAGHLVMTARAEPGGECWYGTCLYTSARLKS